MKDKMQLRDKIRIILKQHGVSLDILDSLEVKFSLLILEEIDHRSELEGREIPNSEMRKWIEKEEKFVKDLRDELNKEEGKANKQWLY